MTEIFHLSTEIRSEFPIDELGLIIFITRL